MDTYTAVGYGDKKPILQIMKIDEEIKQGGSGALDGIIRKAEENARRNAEALDEAVFSAVLKVGVVVDKEELLKALHYDRNQYEEGFRAGRAYKPQPITNGDKIRSMTDYELAGWIEHIAMCGACTIDCMGGNFNSRASCARKWREWLQQNIEVDEDDEEDEEQ